MFNYAKFYLLAATAFPGVTRIVGVVLIEKYFGADQLGAILNDINVVTQLTFFTAIGWCSLLINRVASENSKTEQLKIFHGVLIASLPVIIVATILIVILVKIEIVNYMAASILYMISFSIYQFIRHYCFAARVIKVLLAIEVAILLLLLICFCFTYYVNKGSELIFVIPLIMVSVVWQIFTMHKLYLRKQGYVLRQRNILVHSQYFGLSNMASGGVFLMLVPISAYLLSNIYAAMVGIIVTVVSVIMIFSRSITNHYLPTMARLFKSNDADKLKVVLNKYRMIVASSMFVLSAITALLTGYLAPRYYPDLFILDGSVEIFFLLFSYLFVSQLFLTDASLLVVQEKSQYSLLVNISVLVLLVVAFVLINVTIPGQLDKLIVFLISMFVVQLVKGYILYSNTRLYCRSTG